MSETSPLGAVVKTVAEALVDKPEGVRVIETERRGMTIVELFPGAGEVGKVVGRQGRTAAALRTLLQCTAEFHGKKATLEIRD